MIGYFPTTSIHYPIWDCIFPIYFYNGIFSAAMPIESLHALEDGLIKDCLQILYKEDLKAYWCTRLDVVVKQMCSFDKQFNMTGGSHHSMPCLL